MNILEACLATVIIEIAVITVFYINAFSKDPVGIIKLLLYSVLVNIITNLTLNMTLNVLDVAYPGGIHRSYFVIIPVEILICAAECFLFSLYNGRKIKLFAAVIAANAVSFTIGCFL